MNDLRQRSDTTMQPRDCSRISGWRPALWLALLVVAAVAFTLGLACAMPFAGLGAAAALTLSRRDALILTATAWLANQVIGFAFLSYPWTGHTVAWGVVLGFVAVLTTLAANGLVGRIAGRGIVSAALAGFAGAFVVYEGLLFLVSAAWLGGTEDFAPAIVAYILAVNAGAFFGLLALNRVGLTIGLARKVPLWHFAAVRRA
jgi:hypothetical protein